MTCFSIQKSLHIILLSLALTFTVFATAWAQTASDVSPEQAKEAENARIQKQMDKDEASGKVDAPIVIELFTGADCSACIFADRILYDAMKDKQVIALSCRVNDTTALLGSSKEAKRESVTDGPMDPCVFRQWTYNISSVSDVTMKMPVFYFNGKDPAKADGSFQFGDKLNRYHYNSSNKLQEAMLRWKDKDTISIHLPNAKEEDKKINASVWVVRYKNMDVVRMDKGINAGRVLRFSNVIQNITHVAKWHGDMRVVNVDVTPPAGGNEKGGYVVLVGEMLGMPYMAAGKLEDYPVTADIQAEAAKRAKARAAAEEKDSTSPSPVKTPEKANPAAP